MSHFINPHGKVFTHIDRLVEWQRGGHPAPVTVEWDLSNRCTLGCQDCHFAYTHTRGPWTVKARRLPMAFDAGGDLADIGLVLRVLQEMSDFGVRSIVWTGGGEPTTHPDWVTAVRAADDFGLSQGMYTLGGLFTDDTARVLAERATWVVVSLDACDPVTYSHEKNVPQSRFDAAIQGVRRLSYGRATVGVSFLLHEKNWWQADRMRSLALALGATYATFRPTVRFDPHYPGMPVGDVRWIDDAMPTLQALAKDPHVELNPERFAQYRDWRGHGYDACYGIRLNTTITPDGRVWVCPNRRGLAQSSIGDLRTESFRELWQRFSGLWTDFTECRVLCRLHPVNQTLATVYAERPHANFI